MKNILFICSIMYAALIMCDENNERQRMEEMHRHSMMPLWAKFQLNKLAKDQQEIDTIPSIRNKCIAFEQLRRKSLLTGNNDQYYKTYCPEIYQAFDDEFIYALKIKTQN